jgi:ubiquinone/menaquinone biosynthesis C-methylase UbiE
MNALENWFCSSRIWRRVTERTILPWLMEGAELGEHVLEIGAGAGAATAELRRRARRVTSLEYSARLAARLVQRDRLSFQVVQGDATRLPFAAAQFSAVLAVLMLHHLPSEDAQDRAFGEAARVLRAGGVFIAFEIHDRWLQRLSHFRSTFTPLRAETLAGRLAAAGFGAPRIDSQPQGFRLLVRK